MPARKHEYLQGAVYGCWTVVRELASEDTSWGKQRKVLARCQCGVEKPVLPKMLHRCAPYCQSCNPGRKPEKYAAGEVHGPWTILEEIDGVTFPSGYKDRRFRARCRCGNVTAVSPSQLRRSDSCMRCRRTVMVTTGQRFGQITVVIPEVKGKRHRTTRFQCDCGTEFEEPPHAIASGSKHSCGCLKERAGPQHPCWGGTGEMSGQYWNSIKKGADHRGIAFHLTPQPVWDLFVAQGGECALSGVPLCFGPSQTASLDRIDSNGSYTLDNIQWVHKEINIMKGTLTEDRFRELCSLVVAKC